jgi:DNA segregation ATPase FtsK/SpoIIIE, S-DNA-T family
MLSIRYMISLFLIGLGAACLSIFFCSVFFSSSYIYTPNLLQEPTHSYINLVDDAMILLFGNGRFFFSLYIGLMGYYLLRKMHPFHLLNLSMLWVSIMSIIHHLHVSFVAHPLPGGIVGKYFVLWGTQLAEDPIFSIMLGLIFFVSLICFTGIEVIIDALKILHHGITFIKQKQFTREELIDESTPAEPYVQEPASSRVEEEIEIEDPSENKQAPYTIPQLTFNKKLHQSTYQVKDKTDILQKTLAQFGITGKVTRVQHGAAISRYEFIPDEGIRLNRITALEDDIACALEAMTVRILAPIPGTNMVGFEVASNSQQIIFAAELFAQGALIMHPYTLPLVLGKSINGSPLVIDLCTQPHLLIAGSTGSGKSVCIHTIIMSIICNKSPDDVQLILIDPKRLELTPYSLIPHLLFPVITDGPQVLSVLSYAITKMEERYKKMASLGCKNWHEYTTHGFTDIPLMVIIIDELADLMITLGKSCEEMIIRLTQMARAAGIHVIMATQRPSVDVLTGLIKVNVPARIAFKVASKIDSRTILDTQGAEKLLGKGDMLYLDPRGVLHRAQGAWITSEEIEDVVFQAHSQREAVYEELVEVSTSTANMDAEDEQLYQKILPFVESQEEISISLLQRTFRIGYNRSARMVQLLEQRGVISAFSKSKMRKVVRQSVSP